MGTGYGILNVSAYVGCDMLPVEKNSIRDHDPVNKLLRRGDAYFQ